MNCEKMVRTAICSAFIDKKITIYEMGNLSASLKFPETMSDDINCRNLSNKGKTYLIELWKNGCKKNYKS